MSDEDALIAALQAHPDDDTPPLVLADFYDDYDQPAKAEYLRVMIEELRQKPGPGKDALSARRTALGNTIPFAWVKPLLQYRFERMARAAAAQLKALAVTSPPPPPTSPPPPPPHPGGDTFESRLAHYASRGGSRAAAARYTREMLDPKK